MFQKNIWNISRPSRSNIRETTALTKVRVWTFPLQLGSVSGQMESYLLKVMKLNLGNLRRRHQGKDVKLLQGDTPLTPKQVS
ncbi:hypothetical protein MKW92_015477 [Papaver armeniacum]|nr:hypothetical protein MKW92_015477 [Papaver armeniacum]